MQKDPALIPVGLQGQKAEWLQAGALSAETPFGNVGILLVFIVHFLEPQTHKQAFYKGGTAKSVQTCSYIIKWCGKGR